jgi:hypothetical protein
VHIIIFNYNDKIKVIEKIGICSELTNVARKLSKAVANLFSEYSPNWCTMLNNHRYFNKERTVRIKPARDMLSALGIKSARKIK